MFVLDNSITMRWYFGDGKSADLLYASDILESMKKEVALVPVTWGLEVANVIARAEAKSIVTESRSRIFLDLLSNLNIVTDEATSEFALADTLELARRYGLSSYDASYLELALRSGTAIATIDENLMKAAKKSGVQKYLL